MVATRGMEARLEFLERGYEAFMATREELQELRIVVDEERLERIETRRQLGELLETVSGLTIRSARSGNGGGSSDESQIRDERWRKLEVPVFDSGDGYGWANRVERYFELKGLSDEEKLTKTG